MIFQICSISLFERFSKYFLLFLQQYVKFVNVSISFGMGDSYLNELFVITL